MRERRRLTLQEWKRAGYLVSDGRTGKRPCLTPESILNLQCFHLSAGTEGPIRLPHFPHRTPPQGAFTGLSSQPGSKLLGRYSQSLHARPTGLQALARIPSGHTSRYAIAQPSCVARLPQLPAANRGGLSPPFQLVRITWLFASRVRFTFARARASFHWHWQAHGINGWDYSESWRDSGLLQTLPHAPDKLHYEHPALRDDCPPGGKGSGTAGDS